MNIFISSDQPELAAAWLDDARARVCVTNNLVLMNQTLLKNKGAVMAPLGGLGLNTIPAEIKAWVDDKVNYCWLFKQTEHLVQRGLVVKKVATFNEIKELSADWLQELEGEKPTSFVNYAKSSRLLIDFRNVEDVFEAYRLFLNRLWDLTLPGPEWVTGVKPYWRKEKNGQDTV